MSSSHIQTTEQQQPSTDREQPKQKRVPLFYFLLPVVAFVLLGVWLLYTNTSTSTDPTVAGRPLSNPQMHLHTVALGGKPGTLYLGSHFGIFTSTDSGKSWPEQRGTLDKLMVTTIVFSPRNPSYLALLGSPSTADGSPAGTYFSQDGGKSWQLRNPANLPKTSSPYTISPAYDDSQHFYAYYLYAGWFETRDMGRSWQPFIDTNLTNMQSPTLLTSPANPEHLLLGGSDGLFASQDNGKSWNKVTDVQGQVYDLVASQSNGPRTLYCATDQGLYTWKEGSDRITSLKLPGKESFTRLALDASGTVLYGLSGRDLWYSNTGGQNWTRRLRLDRSDCIALLVDPQQPARVYIGLFLPPKVVYSEDSGAHWQTLTDATTP